MKQLLLGAVVVFAIGCDPEEEPDPIAPPPPNAAQGVSFLDNDIDGDQIAGVLSILPALDESNATNYHLYWGSSHNTKLAGEPLIVSLPVGSATLEHTFVADSAVPAGATHFLVYTFNSAAKFDVPTATDVSVPTATEVRDLTIERVADIRPGSPSSNPASFAMFADQLYFAADTDTQGRELFVYDGSGSPSVAQDIHPSGSSDPEFLTPYGGKLFFRATDGGVTNSAFRLWEYDGSNDAALVDPFVAPSNLGVFGTSLYFLGFEGLEGGEPWVYDGANPPHMVADIMDQTLPQNDSSPSNFTPFEGDLYFAAADRDHGRELWALDISTAPWRVTDINPTGNAHPEDLIVYEDGLYFSATDGDGYEVWHYDGTNPPNAVTALNSSRMGIVPSDLCIFEGTLYFQGDDGTHGAELFGYTVAAGANLVADIDGQSTDSAPSDLTVFDDKLYFAATGYGTSRELWMFDGSNPPVVYEFFEGQGGGNPQHLFVYDDALYFSATDSTVADRELWRLHYQ